MTQILRWFALLFSASWLLLHFKVELIGPVVHCMMEQQMSQWGQAKYLSSKPWDIVQQYLIFINYDDIKALQFCWLHILCLSV